MPTITITDDNFEREVVASAEPMLIDFWAEWCGPCKMIGPSLEELSDELAGTIRIGKVDIEANKALAERYGIRSIPALAIVKAGEVVDMKVGAAPKARIAEWVKSKI